MSLAGVTLHEVKVWRSTEGTSPSGAASIVYSGSGPYPARVEVLTRARAQRLFGWETEARAMGLVDRGVPVQQGDVLEVTAGRATGEFFLVVSKLESPGWDALLLELTSTPERPA